MYLILLIPIGCLLGRVAAGWSAVMLKDMNSGGLVSCPACETPVTRFQRWFSPAPIRCHCGAPAIRWHIGSAAGLGCLFWVFSWLLLDLNCESVDEVRPTAGLITSRLPFHLSLIFLLWVATVTDLLDYVIPDEVIRAGVVIALAAAFTSGELQMIHIWVDWDQVIPGVQGPYLPEWMKDHQHLHGIAWSVSGLLCGSLLTWGVRALSHAILGYPALGGGDVTLMAMIGAFLGWQPALCVLAIAPLTGMVVGLLVRLLTGRTFVAYGPYLACSAVIVMSSWRWLWADTFVLRDIFSHWPSIAGLIGFSFVTLVILLGMIRIFRALPVDAMKR